jgi:peptidoglycan/LPS O-acetylase OafA/YrhL
MRERIHYLDSARGLAALPVVAPHFHGLFLNFKPKLHELRAQYIWLNDFWQEEITLRRIVKESLLIIDIANPSKRIVTQDWSIALSYILNKTVELPFIKAGKKLLKKINL